jgi:kinetochore protein Nuf2
MMERIRHEFELMDRERQENDRQVEELRAMADEVERNVCLSLLYKYRLG